MTYTLSIVREPPNVYAAEYWVHFLLSDVGVVADLETFLLKHICNYRNKNFCLKGLIKDPNVSFLEGQHIYAFPIFLNISGFI